MVHLSGFLHREIAEVRQTDSLSRGLGLTREECLRILVLDSRLFWYASTNYYRYGEQMKKRPTRLILRDTEFLHCAVWGLGGAVWDMPFVGGVRENSKYWVSIGVLLLRCSSSSNSNSSSSSSRRTRRRCRRRSFGLLMRVPFSIGPTARIG